jgi:hypothetical protein
MCGGTTVAMLGGGGDTMKSPTKNPAKKITLRELDAEQLEKAAGGSEGASGDQFQVGNVLWTIADGGGFEGGGDGGDGGGFDGGDGGDGGDGFG